MCASFNNFLFLNKKLTFLAFLVPAKLWEIQYRFPHNKLIYPCIFGNIRASTPILPHKLILEIYFLSIDKKKLTMKTEKNEILIIQMNIFITFQTLLY